MSPERRRLALRTLGSVASLLLTAVVAVHGQALQRGLYVSVVDGKGQPVENIGPNDLIVREDNVTREILRVQPATDPIQIAVLVDTSQASSNFIRDYRQALPAFLDVVLGDEAGGQNQVAIIGIGERPTILSDYTTDRKKLQSGIDRLFAIPNAGTYLLDAIMEVGQGLEKRKAERPVMLALTTEGPELSQRNFQLVLDRLKSSKATLHVIGIGSPVNFDQDRSAVISIGPKNTGGRTDQLLLPSGLKQRLQEVGKEIISQYRVTYARPDSLIPPEKIDVAAKRDGLTARGIAITPPPGAPGTRGR